MDINETLFLGNCLEELKKLPDNSVDSLVTDPPYGLSKEPNITEVLTKWLNNEPYDHAHNGFMGKKWDSFVPHPEIFKEVHRVLKPGAHGVVFAGTRTQDLMTISLRLAGFEVRDVIEWIYFSGFPKALDVSKAIDKKLGAERETYKAKRWEGWKSALKPSHEPIILIRKPLSEKNIVDNVLLNGTGALNIDGCRIGDEEIETNGKMTNKIYGKYKSEDFNSSVHRGRFPANCITEIDDEFFSTYFNITPKDLSKKASKKERNSDYLGEPISGEEKNVSHDGRKKEIENAYQRHSNVQTNFHPTVKSVDLMSWLVRLITPPQGTVLDPFAGSGSTLVAAKREGFSYIGIEMNEEYMNIIQKRTRFKEF